MVAQWTPMRWPDAWKDPAALSLLKGTAIDYLLIGKGNDLGAVRDRAQQNGLRVADPEALPSGITRIKGEWPGVKMSRGGAATRGAALIVNLPGSPRAAVDSLNVVAGLIPHAVDLLHGRTQH